MFTGIIETIADVKSHVVNNDILQLVIDRPEGWKIVLGQSIAHDGVCLTVTEFNEDSFTVELMPETVKRSTFRADSLPARVNLERAMRADAMFEGHIVQAHVDELSKIVKIEQDDQWRVVHVAFPPEKASMVVEKGSITIDGISLTVVDVFDDSFTVALIPHTIEHTTLGSKKVGDSVNLEYDILGKYITKYLSRR